ncbi:4-coumarate--CoA ligase [Nitrincola sp. A-D6]|uniref:nucleotide sugar dehydrogenase n=1 Tax=Nitrincola sp. A-D6 TaxID=1545442 RepID=UPI00051FCB99|nr:nucleotide sugar dehydrogenase [Nitrincola sp. A-D6]KGK42880.1 4-coumarate--CoA ligase [Nitrincola sp. A-D6]
MKIAVWGSELIGWTAATAFAEFGNQVHVNQMPDSKQSLGEQSESNSILFNEPGLLSHVKAQYDLGNLTFGDPDAALNCPIQILALHPDQFPLAKTIIQRVNQQSQPEQLVVINYSTFGLGATDELATLLDTDKQQAIAYIPDQLSEGSAYDNFIIAKTLVIGCQSNEANKVIKALYKPFSRSLEQMMIVKRREAEFMKFAVNGMLALRLGYINELANLADLLNIDIDTITSGMGSDPRIGKHYLAPGCGFGGAHFSKSIQNMAELLKTNRNSIILNTLLEENEKQKVLPFRKLWRHYKADVTDLKVAVWGLSFKPNTASIQNAPSLQVVETLLAQGCKVHAHDPQAMMNFAKRFPSTGQIAYYNNAIETLKDADALIILTEWNEYWSPDYYLMLKLMKNPVIIDGRNIMDKELMESFGFVYYGVGR